MSSIGDALIMCWETMSHMLIVIRKKDSKVKYLLIEHRRINRREN